MKKTIRQIRLSGQVVLIGLMLALSVPVFGSQHDMEITTSDANTGTTYRNAVNSALQALVSQNSGASAPSTTYAYQVWADTSTGKLKMRNGSNTSWLDVLDLTDGISFNSDSAANGNPVGTVLPYAGSSAPTGYLLADGSAVSRTTYAALFAIVSTTYGVGDGSTTFNLPNLKGKIPAGFNSAETEFDALGETGGAKTHTLSSGEMPTHTHTDSGHTHNYVKRPSAGVNLGSGSTNIYVDNESSVASESGTANLSNAGSGSAHNNLQPYITLNYIIKY